MLRFIQITVLLIFLITELTIYLQPVREKYTAIGATIGPSMSVEFESDSISLQLPPEGVTLEGGWKIIPMSPPVVRNLIVGHQNLNRC